MSGQVRLDGTDLLTLNHDSLNRMRGPKISMIFQEPMSALNPVMRVGQQIAEGPRIHLGYSRSRAAGTDAGADAQGRHPRPGAAVPRLPARVLRRHAAAGDDRDRAGLRAEIILCDEPTTALDVTIQDQILRLLAGLCRESGVSLVFVTHDLPVVAQVCQQVAVMYGGQLVERGDVARCCSTPGTRTRSGWSARHRTSSTSRTRCGRSRGRRPA